MVMKFISAAMLAIFLQNTIFSKALGVDILLYASRRRSNVIGFALGLCYIMALSSAGVWCLDRFFMDYEHFPMITPVLYVSIVGIIYIISLVIIWLYFPRLYANIKKFVHLTVFNCAVLGGLFLNRQVGASIFSYMGYGLGTALGFFVAGYLLYIAHARLNSELVPAAFRGMPIMIIYVAILSMALQGFAGYIV